MGNARRKPNCRTVRYLTCQTQVNALYVCMGGIHQAASAWKYLLCVRIIMCRQDNAWAVLILRCSWWVVGARMEIVRHLTVISVLPAREVTSIMKGKACASSLTLFVSVLLLMAVWFVSLDTMLIWTICAHSYLLTAPQLELMVSARSAWAGMRLAMAYVGRQLPFLTVWK